MTNDMIENYLSKQPAKVELVNIHFRQRNNIKGLFIRTKDYQELKSKNLWRIVSESNFSEWKKTMDESLARIFNGAEFTRLSPV
jgi:predicted small secreted protein